MKNSRYFRHDWGARNDPKILRLVRVKGAVAKAVYWDLVEMLYEEGGILPRDAIEDVTFQNHLEDTGLAEYVVYKSGLFSFDDKCFWSERQRRDERRISEISKVRKDVGKLGGEAKVKQNESKSQANGKQNESKQGYNKINKEINKDINNISSLHLDMPPTPEELEVLVSGEPIEKGLTDAQCKEVVSLWNSIVKRSKATYSTVVAISEERKNQIRIRWKEFEKVGNPWQVCETIFHKACASNFLQGEGSKGWKANFDWIFHNGKNWPKIYEGVYDNKTAPGTPEQGGFMGRLATQLQEIDEYYSNPDNGNTKTTDNAGPDEQQFGW